MKFTPCLNNYYRQGILKPTEINIDTRVVIIIITLAGLLPSFCIEKYFKL